jgi:hypothetical protein
MVPEPVKWARDSRKGRQKCASALKIVRHPSSSSSLTESQIDSMAKMEMNMKAPALEALESTSAAKSSSCRI